MAFDLQSFTQDSSFMIVLAGIGGIFLNLIAPNAILGGPLIGYGLSIAVIGYGVYTYLQHHSGTLYARSNYANTINPYYQYQQEEY